MPYELVDVLSQMYGSNATAHVRIPFTLTATAPVMTEVDSAAPNATNRFYRVLLNP